MGKECAMCLAYVKMTEDDICKDDCLRKVTGIVDSSPVTTPRVDIRYRH